MSADEEMTEDEPFEANDGDYVPAFFARDMDEAEEYCELLSDHDIPARCGVDEELGKGSPDQRLARRRGMTHGVPVLVPETLLDEASEIIADREDFTDFDEDDEEDVDEDEDEEEGFGLGQEADGEEEEEEDDFLEDEEGDEGDGLFGSDDDEDEDEELGEDDELF